MEIRRLIKDDLDNFFNCRLRALKSSPTAFLTSYEEEKANGASRFLKSLNHSGNESAIFAALDGKTVTATLGIYKEDHIKKNHRAVIWGMYVDENYRGQGLGRRLLDTAIEFAQKKMQVASVALSVESKNESAKKLYLSKGFKCWGVEPKAMNYDGVYLDEDHMVFFFE